MYLSAVVSTRYGGHFLAQHIEHLGLDFDSAHKNYYARLNDLIILR